MNIAYTEIIPILTNTVKDLYNEIDKMKDMIGALKYEVQCLKNEGSSNL